MSKFSNQREDNKVDGGLSKNKFDRVPKERSESSIQCTRAPTNSSAPKGDEADGGPENSLNQTGYTDFKFKGIQPKNVAPVLSCVPPKYSKTQKNPGGKPETST